MDVLLIDGSHQQPELTAQVAWSAIGSLEQHWLEPTVEVLDGTIALGAGWRDEDWFDLQPQTQTDDAAKITCRITKAAELATVVELCHLWQTQML